MVRALLACLTKGIRLLLLIGVVGNFYIPYDYHASAALAERDTLILKLERVKLGLFYMSTAMEIDTGNLNPVDFVRSNARGVLRCIYSIFEKDTCDS